MEGAAYWGAYYRANPDKFCNDYLHIHLRTFQKFLLTMMFWSTTFVLIACRGLGKTFLSAIYCVIRCILYPGTRVCISSGTRGQAIQVLEKIIQELKPKSPELCAEIDDKETRINGNDAQISFKNTSIIKVVTANDNARGNRCNVLLLDEYRLIQKDTIDTVLKNFLNYRRMPQYNQLSEEERNREYDKEKNLTLWLTSAYLKDHWAYTKCEDTLKAMLDDTRRQFLCGFPYQLSIQEGILDPDIVADTMAERNFSEIKFSMEMDALWYGSDGDSFFDSTSISKNRRIKYPMLPDKICSKITGGSPMRIQPKQNGEMRILSADIALMSSGKNKNDATAIFINQLTPTKMGRHISNIIYAETCEGLRTDDQALVIRRLFDEYNCDYLVLDCSGLGLGVYDALARDISDPDAGEIYPALSCCNNPDMAARCTSVNAQKVIWAIKGNLQFNSDCAFLLREGFRSGRIRLLIMEDEADVLLGDVKGYKALSPSEKLAFQLPYIHTTLLIDELTKLRHEETGGRVRLYEKSGMRKDRYSSLSYNFYVATQLENKLSKKQSASGDESFIIKAPQYNRKAVSSIYGKTKSPGWY